MDVLREGWPGDTNVRVQVDGVTFGAIYEVAGAMLELTSADFGYQTAEVGDEDPQAIAERVLRTMVRHAMRYGDVPFLRDDGTVATPTGERGT